MIFLVLWSTYVTVQYILITHTEYDNCKYIEEIGSSEESGKDWSDLEAEAAEADKTQGYFEDEYTRGKGGSKGSRPGPSSSAYRDKDRGSSSKSKSKRSVA